MTDASRSPYAPADSSDWDVPPGKVDNALDELADRATNLKADTIDEKTTDTGTTIESVLIKDGLIGTASVDHKNLHEFLTSFSVSDQDVTSSTTYVDATKITLNLPASETWAFQVQLFWESGTTPDIKVRTQDSGIGGTYGIWTLEGGRSDTSYGSTTFTSGESGKALAGTNAPALSTIGGLYVCAGVATIHLEFAQNTSNATAATVLRGSNMIAWKVA